MKKYLILGGVLMVVAFGYANEYQLNLNPATSCPTDECDSGNEICCKTKGGSTYYGKCRC